MISEQDAQLDAQGNPGVPRLSPDFLIETYLDHQVSFYFISYPTNTHPVRRGGGGLFPPSHPLTFLCVLFSGGTFLPYL